MLVALSISIVSAAAILFFSRRLLCYLRHFQENSYSKTQFTNWMLTNGIYDRKGSAIAAIAALTIELTKEKILISLAVCIITAVALIWLCLWENDPRKFGSFKLQETRQAASIYNLALGLYSIALIITILGAYALGAGDDIAVYWLIVIMGIQSSPLWLILANSLKKRF